MFACTSLLKLVLLSCSLFTRISPETDHIEIRSEIEDDPAPLEACEPNVLSSSNRISIDSKYSTGLDLFVCPGMRMYPRLVFVDVHLTINLTDPSTFQLYQAENCSSVQEAYDSDHRLFGLLKSVNLWRSMQLDPFSRTIIGIATTEKYSIGLIVNPISVWRLGLFVGAIFLYLFSPWLVRNALVFYATGCTGGALLSALFLVFLLYRVAPKKTIGIPILLGGWSAAAWMAVHGWNNFSSIMMQYQKYVALYFVTAMIISFAYCYRHGPPTNVRSLDLATWLFQIVACFLIYFSSQVPWISYTVIAILILSSALLSSTSRRMMGAITSVWTYFFPRPRRLLTEEEYEKEAAEVHFKFTQKELARLREFCRSPEANSWKMTSRIKSPQRFARFVEGEDGHVSLREEREHLTHALDAENYFEPDEEEELMTEDDDVFTEYERWKEMEEQERRERFLRHRRSMGSSRLSELRDRFPSANTSRSSEFPTHRSSTVPRPPRATASASTVLRPPVVAGSSSTPRAARKAPQPRLPAINRDYYSSDEDEDSRRD
ncbi:hypothetical protein PFISCL1PPCAC_10863 [Pristionchus fissidentatus]|uniref:Nuclear envelope integral membrane protein 1 n=1 Tax=Pristionchus fissidentatus TaxID=1538716 RepID=A0AAV5VLR7_9BILA|nr:hypothetical protein PFISCL1PPCAC_10863 [Pristionchus fissidentatus]